MADAHKNFAYSTVLTAPSPATSGTSLVLQSGAGLLMPAVPFNATVWPANTIPLASNAEIVRVTNISTDTLTIVRAQESSSAVSIAAGYQFSAGITAKTLTDVEAAIMPSGGIIPYSGITAPSNWLLCNGAAVSRSTYATLFSLYNPSLGTVTMTIASPGVFTLTAHGLKNGDTVFFTTTGALPTGVTANTVYYVDVINANTFHINTSPNSVGVTPVNTSGTQSGTHTLFRSLFGVGDGSTTFNVPDLRGRVAAGVEDMGGVGSASRLTGFANAPPNPLAIGGSGGTESHTLTIAQLAAHSHSLDSRMMIGQTAGSGFNSGLAGGGAYNAVGVLNDTGASTVTGSQGSGTAHNNTQPTILMNYIVKT